MFFPARKAVEGDTASLPLNFCGFLPGASTIEVQLLSSGVPPGGTVWYGSPFCLINLNVGIKNSATLCVYGVHNITHTTCFLSPNGKTQSEWTLRNKKRVKESEGRSV